MPLGSWLAQARGMSVAVVVKVGPAVRTEYRDLMLDQFWFFLAHLPSVSRRALLS